MTPLGPGFDITTHCVQRSFDNGITFAASQSEVDACNAFTTYGEVWPCMYGNPHIAGHGGVNGTMADAFVSPADPIFYMHHAFIDKMWSDWQNLDRQSRLYDVSGPNTQDPEIGFPEFPGSIEDEAALWGVPSEEQTARMPSGQEGDDGDETTLNHIMSTLGIIPNATIRDVMDTTAGYLCYEYV